MRKNGVSWQGLSGKQKKIKKKQLHRRNTAMVLSALFAFLMLFSLTAPGQRFWSFVNGGENLNGIPLQVQKDPLNIYFLDVGKADSIIITCENYSLLIDAGTYVDSETVEIWLKKLNIDRLNAVFASHPDSDHIGGIPYILENFKVDELIVSDIPAELLSAENEYNKLMSAALNNDIAVKTVYAGDILNYGNCSFEVLGPLGDHADMNNYSLVQKLIYKNFSALFPGDAENRSENMLLNSGADLTADLLKVAHHGSKTSSSKEFLEAVGAEYAVVSTGVDRNNLPRKEVLRALEEYSMDIYRTDVDGTVIVSSDGDETTIIQEK